MTATPLRVHDLCVFRGGRIIVERLSGTFPAGMSTAIVGPNGAGKTTLMEALAGDAVVTSGTIHRPPRRDVAYLPQASRIESDFPICVFDLVGMGLWHSIHSFAGLDQGHRQRVREAIATAGLSGAERRLIGEMSAGQVRRALFARTIAQDADVILLDEPFGGLDDRTTDDLLAVLHRWTKEGRTVVAVLHEIDLVEKHFDLALVLARRAIAWGPVREAIGEGHLREARCASRSWDDATPAQKAIA